MASFSHLQNEMLRLQDEINDVFHSSMGHPTNKSSPRRDHHHNWLAPSIGWPNRSCNVLATRQASYYPHIDLKETENELKLIADLPGIEKSDIKVDISDGNLSIAGSRKSEVEKEGNNWHVKERSCGSFYRCVRLPSTAQQEGIKAIYNNGVLEVTVPKSSSKSSSSITIQ